MKQLYSNEQKDECGGFPFEPVAFIKAHSKEGHCSVVLIIKHKLKHIEMETVTKLGEAQFKGRAR